MRDRFYQALPLFLCKVEMLGRLWVLGELKIHTPGRLIINTKLVKRSKLCVLEYHCLQLPSMFTLNVHAPWQCFEEAGSS